MGLMEEKEASGRRVDASRSSPDGKPGSAKVRERLEFRVGGWGGLGGERGLHHCTACPVHHIHFRAGHTVYSL